MYFLGENIGNTPLGKIDKVTSTMIESKINSPIKITLKNNIKEAKLSDLSITINNNDQLPAIKGERVYDTFLISPAYIYRTAFSKNEITPVIRLGNETENKLKELFKDQLQNAQNASIELDDNGNINISEGHGELTIDTKNLQNLFTECLKTGCKDIISLEYKEVNPKVKKTDIEPYKDEIKSFLDKKIMVQINSNYYRLKDTDKIGIIDVEKTIQDKKLSFSEGTISNFLNDIAKKYDTKGKTRKISETDGAVLDEGTEGLAIDVSQSAKIILDALNNGDDLIEVAVKVTPVEEEKVSPGYNPGKYAGRYIEVNLSQQELYLFDGSNLIASFPVSTGKWSMPTPTGEFTIQSKTERAYSNEYGLYMPWWMAFIGDQYGIHELPEWPNGTKEGENHLGTPISHGCIRLGVGAAQQVYNSIDVGTPVFIHT